MIIYFLKEFAAAVLHIVDQQSVLKFSINNQQDATW